MRRIHTALAFTIMAALPRVAQAQLCQGPTWWTTNPGSVWCGMFGWQPGGGRFDRDGAPLRYQEQDSGEAFTPPTPLTPLQFFPPVPNSPTGPSGDGAIPEPTPPPGAPQDPPVIGPPQLPLDPPELPPFFLPDPPSNGPTGGPDTSAPDEVGGAPITTNTVPEPGTYLLVGGGLALLLVARRR